MCYFCYQIKVKLITKIAHTNINGKLLTKIALSDKDEIKYILTFILQMKSDPKDSKIKTHQWQI